MKLSDTIDLLIDCDKCGADFPYKTGKSFGKKGSKIMCPNCNKIYKLLPKMGLTKLKEL